MRWILSFIGFNIIFFSCSYNEDTKKVENAAFEKANEFAKKQMFDSAIYYTEKALELNDSSLYLSNIGVYYIMQNIPQKAIVYLDSALKLDLNNSKFYYNRAAAYKLLKLNDKAIEDYNKALEITPDCLEAKEGLSDLYFETDDSADYESAVKYATEILIKDPLSIKYRYIRGKSFSRLGDYEKAFTDFNEILTLDSLNFHVLIERSYSLTGLQKFDLAINDLQKVISIKPNEPMVAYRNLAEIYLKVKRDKNKACEYIHLDSKVYNKETSKEDLQKYCGK